jgi:hypothetical protein
MKTFIKTKLRESLLEEEQLNEVNWKGLAAGAAMTLGTLGAQGQSTEPTTQAPTTQTTTTEPTTKQKPMFGTPEQRLAAKEKRLNQRKKNFDISVNNAYGVGLNDPDLNIVNKINDAEFNNGCSLDNNEELDYLEGRTSEPPSVVYREMGDGTKIKINMSRYFKYVRKQNRQDDVPLDGLMAPNFKPTKCGISKQHAKDDKKDFKNK